MDVVFKIFSINEAQLIKLLTSLFVRRYLAGSDVLSDFSCQKKLVCELYWESDDLGELSSRGAHGLDLLLAGADVSRYVTLPQPVNNAIEEFKVRKDSESLYRKKTLFKLEVFPETVILIR